MCGRYAVTLPPEAMREAFAYREQPNFPPRYNIAPTQPVPVVRLDEGRRQFILMRWGFIPGWVKDPRDYPLVINVRSESAGEKSFAPSAKRQEDAAKKGDVLRSKELATAAAILIGAAWLKLAGPWLLETFGNALRAGFTWNRAALENFDVGPILLSLMLMALPPIMLLGVLVVVSSLVSQMSFGQGRWVAGNLAPIHRRAAGPPHTHSVSSSSGSRSASRAAR